MDLLPDDVVADVLGRLAPCGLAVSRCVRKSWRTIVDTRRLLRTNLLPLQLDGLFCLDDTLNPPPYFFARNRSTGCRRIAGGRLDFLGTPLDRKIIHHCNGLLLLDNDLLDKGQAVVNPATRQWVRLPHSPVSAGMEDFYRDYCILYDPMVSPHSYEVVLIHLLPRVLGPSSKFEAGSEWPPSPYTTHVFSSRSWRWEERSFVRQGEAAGTIADRLPETSLFERHAVYLRRKLYVHCENHSVMRITLSDDKYRVLKCPTVSEMVDAGDREMFDASDLSLGKSEKGVYSGVVLRNYGCPRFRVWFLNELCEQMEWLLMSDISLQVLVQNSPLSNHNSWAVTPDEHAEDQAEAQEEFEWDSDDGIVLETNDNNAGTYHPRETYFLGFHPYKEIAFFWVSYWRVVSYHLNSSNVQDLCILNAHCITKSFPYTSCWMGDLCENN